MGEETRAEQDTHYSKYLLHVKYDCGIEALGPEDEWVIYFGKLVLRVGDSGFGRTYAIKQSSLPI